MPSNTGGRKRAIIIPMPATDIQIQAKEIQRLKDTLNSILASQTGQDVKTIEKDTDRDNFMSAAEACKYGLIDEVIEKHK